MTPNILIWQEVFGLFYKIVMIFTGKNLEIAQKFCTFALRNLKGSTL